MYAARLFGAPPGDRRRPRRGPGFDPTWTRRESDESGLLALRGIKASILARNSDKLAVVVRKVDLEISEKMRKKGANFKLTPLAFGPCPGCRAIQLPPPSALLLNFFSVLLLLAEAKKKTLIFERKRGPCLPDCLLKPTTQFSFDSRYIMPPTHSYSFKCATMASSQP